MLIDEPSEGLSPMVADLIFGFISEIQERGISVILVDRNLKHTCKMAQRAYIMVKGRSLTRGPDGRPSENKEIQTRFLAV